MQTVTLTKPLTWGDKTISEFTMRDLDRAGDLRGIKLRDIHDGDVNTILTLTARLSMTPLPPNAVDDISPADVTVIAEKILGFFSGSTTPSPTSA